MKQCVSRRKSTTRVQKTRKTKARENENPTTKEAEVAPQHAPYAPLERMFLLGVQYDAYSYLHTGPVLHMLLLTAINGASKRNEKALKYAIQALLFAVLTGNRKHKHKNLSRLIKAPRRKRTDCCLTKGFQGP